MPLIKIKSFSKPKGSSSGAGSGTSQRTVTTTVRTVERSTQADRLSETRYIWSQPFDGTRDIDGDFLLDGGKSMTVYGPWTAGSYYSSLTHAKWVPAMNAGEMSSWYWRMTDVEIDKGSIVIHDSDASGSLHLTKDGMESSGDMVIGAQGSMTLLAPRIDLISQTGTIASGEGKFDSLSSNGTGIIHVTERMSAGSGLDVHGGMSADEVRSVTIKNSGSITTQDLSVLGNAHFFNLVIDEVRHAGGQIVLSAGSFKIDDVMTDGREVDADRNYGVAGGGRTDLKYRTIYIYQVCRDEDGQVIENTFRPLDHIMCYTTNVSGGQLDARSWWTLVWRTASMVDHVIMGQVKKCNVLEIVSKVQVQGGTWVNPAWGTVTARAGDQCALLGSEDVDRQGAIIMAAYASMDANLEAPYIAKYEHIDGWRLTGKARTWFAANGNRVDGELIVDGAGTTVGQALENLRDGMVPYTHTAWATSSDGTSDFSKVQSAFHTYVGYRTDYTASDSSLQPEDYMWSRLGIGADRLTPVRERLYVSTDDNCWIDVAYRTDTWTNAANSIRLTVWTYSGAKTVRTLPQPSGGTVSYTAVQQQSWTEADPGNRYSNATAELVSPTGQVLDSRAWTVSYDATAVLSVTDIIKARVSDAEGNINSLVMTADSLASRLQDAEGNYNSLVLTVGGMHAEIDEAATPYEDGWIRDKFFEVDVSVDGLSGRITSLEQNQYDDTWIREKTHQLDISVSGLKDEITEVERYVDTSVRVRISDLEVSVGGLSYMVSDNIVGCVNLLDGTNFGVDDNAFVTGKWTGTMTLNPPSLSYGPDSEHGYASLASGASISQGLTGELLPGTWYTFQVYADEPDLTLSVVQNLCDTSEHAAINGDVQTSVQSSSVSQSFSAYEATAMPAQHGFKRYWYTFRTRGDLSQQATLTLSISAQRSMKISMPKLEEGKFASTYDYSERDLQAQFSVQADRAYILIRDGLVSSGIDITARQITLSSENTVIEGNLNIRNSSTGIVLYGAGGDPKVNILASGVGSFSAPQLVGQYTAYWDKTSYNPHVTSWVDVGRLSGTLSLSGAYVHMLSSTTVMQISYEVMLKKQGGSSVRAAQGTAYGTQTTQGAYRFDIQSFTWNVPSEGAYSLQFRILGTWTGMTHFGFNFDLTRASSDFTHIGLDGFYSRQDADKYLWNAGDSIRMRHGANEIKMDAASGLSRVGLTRYSTDSYSFPASPAYSDIATTAPVARVVGASPTFEPSLQDGVIAIYSTGSTVNLPVPGDCPGKMYFIKLVNGNAGTYTLMSHGGQTIMPRDGASTVTQMTIDNDSQIFVSTGDFWVQFECG